MRKRVIEIFTTFMKFESDSFGGWVMDGELRRSMERQQRQVGEGEGTETFWSLYWHRQWRKQPGGLASRHLSAYLQEACYWAAQKATRVLQQPQYRVSDCFQLASIELERVLAGYDPKRGTSLKSYAMIAYPSLIRDTLRQRQEADICTGWTLLRRLGKKRLLESLSHTGLTAIEIGQYRLAWECYKALYGCGPPATRKLRKPNREKWRDIAQLYNRERQRQLSEAGPALTAETLEQRLSQCVRWVRAYTYPPLTSLNRPSGNEASSEWQDELSDPLQPSLMAAMIKQEEAQIRAAQQAQLNQVIADAIGELVTEQRELLRLYYQAELTQQQIAQQLGLKQYSVSRRLARTREALLRALVEWSQTSLHICPSPDLVSSMSNALEEWLTVHYRNQP